MVCAVLLAGLFAVRTARLRGHELRITVPIGVAVVAGGLPISLSDTAAAVGETATTYGRSSPGKTRCSYAFRLRSSSPTSCALQILLPGTSAGQWVDADGYRQLPPAIEVDVADLRADPEVERVAYFVVTAAVGNAIKYAGPDAMISVTITSADGPDGEPTAEENRRRRASRHQSHCGRDNDPRGPPPPPLSRTAETIRPNALRAGCCGTGLDKPWQEAFRLGARRGHTV